MYRIARGFHREEIPWMRPPFVFRQTSINWSEDGVTKWPDAQNQEARGEGGTCLRAGRSSSRLLGPLTSYIPPHFSCHLKWPDTHKGSDCPVQTDITSEFSQESVSTFTALLSEELFFSCARKHQGGLGKRGADVFLSSGRPCKRERYLSGYPQGTPPAMGYLRHAAAVQNISHTPLWETQILHLTPPHAHPHTRTHTHTHAKGIAFQELYAAAEDRFSA